MAARTPASIVVDVPAISRMLDVDPENLIGSLPPGKWDPLPEELRRTDARKRFILYMLMGVSRSITSLHALLTAKFGDLAVGLRQLGEDSRLLDWNERALAWDAAIEQAAFTHIWKIQVMQLVELSAAQAHGAVQVVRRHIRSAQLLQKIVYRDLRRLESYHDMLDAEDAKGALGNPSDVPRPALAFNPMVISGVLVSAIKLEREARGMDLRDQLMLGKMVPVSTRDAYDDLLTEAIALLPAEAQPAFRTHVHEVLQVAEAKEKLT